MHVLGIRVTWRLLLNIIGVLLLVPLSLVLHNRFGSKPAVAKQTLSSVVTMTANHSTPTQAVKGKIVFIFSVHCLICRVRAGFYGELMRAAPKSGVRVVAVSDVSVAEGIAYLRTLGIEGLDVEQGDIKTFTDKPLPAIVSVNEDGTIARLWAGQLKPQDEADIFEVLGLNAFRLVREPGMHISADMVRDMARHTPGVIVVDSRPRDEFAAGHVGNAINIPQDELAARVPIELPSPLDAVVVIYCRHCTECEAASPVANAPPRNCRLSAKTLLKLGYSQTYILDDSLELLASKGIIIAGKVTDTPEQSSIWTQRNGQAPRR